MMLYVIKSISLFLGPDDTVKNNEKEDHADNAKTDAPAQGT